MVAIIKLSVAFSVKEQVQVKFQVFWGQVQVKFNVKSSLYAVKTQVSKASFWLFKLFAYGIHMPIALFWVKYMYV